VDPFFLWIVVAFFAAAIVYSMVGFGGGSAYLAILALAGVPYQSIPQIGLVCNLVVSAGGVWHFWRGGHLRMSTVMPFVVFSVPMAFVGGSIAVSDELFVVLLAGALFAAGARMFISDRASSAKIASTRYAWWLGAPIGALLGLLAGIVGIGGGIFLAPVLLLSGWATAKQAAAAASVFIFVNSAAGLAGQFSKGFHVDATLIPLVIAAWLGGQIGSRAGAYRISSLGIRRLLAALVVLVSLRLIWGTI